MFYKINYSLFTLQKFENIENSFIRSLVYVKL